MRNVLIVDDEQAVHQAIKALVDWSAYDANPPASAFNGREALTCMDSLRPEIVFVDMNMPLLDGPAFLEQASARFPGTQYIVISGYDHFEFTRAAIRNHVLDYLLKPIDPDELTSALNHALPLLPEAAPDTPGNEVAKEVRAWIDSHYAEEIHLSQLCERFYFTREYLSKVFKARYNCTIHEYIEKVRMEHALELMRDKNRSLQDIAEKLGYVNANYFSKAFKRAFGRSPSEYRSVII